MLIHVHECGEIILITNYQTMCGYQYLVTTDTVIALFVLHSVLINVLLLIFVYDFVVVLFIRILKQAVCVCVCVCVRVRTHTHSLSLLGES